MASALASEVAAQADRLTLWVPVAFGLGAAAYLGLKVEPALAPAAAGAAVLIAGALAVRCFARQRLVIAIATLAADR